MDNGKGKDRTPALPVLLAALDDAQRRLLARCTRDCDGLPVLAGGAVFRAADYAASGALPADVARRVVVYTHDKRGLDRAQHLAMFALYASLGYHTDGRTPLEDHYRQVAEAKGAARRELAALRAARDEELAARQAALDLQRTRLAEEEAALEARLAEEEAAALERLKRDFAARREASLERIARRPLPSVEVALAAADARAALENRAAAAVKADVDATLKTRRARVEEALRALRAAQPELAQLAAVDALKVGCSKADLLALAGEVGVKCSARTNKTVLAERIVRAAAERRGA